jgi:hypothetical protein
MNSKATLDPESTFKRVTVCLETPCVPGELEQWSAAVRDALNHARPMVFRQIEGNHRDHYAGILAEDSEMYRQVLKLKKEDQRLLDRFDALRQRGQRLAEEAPRVGPDELKLQDEVKEIIHDGLALVLDWQHQEIALRSWLQEAFTRDRGVVD